MHEVNHLRCNNIWEKAEMVFYLAPCISFFSCTFRLWCRIGESKNYRFLHANNWDYGQIEMLMGVRACLCACVCVSERERENLVKWCHGLNHLLCKCFPNSWWSYQNCWLDCLKRSESKVRFQENDLKGALNLNSQPKRFNTLTASKSPLIGSWSWAQGFLKCWSDPLRELTISPCNIARPNVSSWKRIQGEMSTGTFSHYLRVYKPNLFAGLFKWSIGLKETAWDQP